MKIILTSLNVAKQANDIPKATQADIDKLFR